MGAFNRNEISVKLAFSILQDASLQDPALVQKILTEVKASDPDGIKALLKLVGVETLGDVVAAAAAKSQHPLVIGQPVTDQGVPFSQLTAGGKSINLNLIPDFLRDASGNIVNLNGNEAINAVTVLNGGVKYGNGYEKAISRAVAKGEFKDGTIILARKSDLLKIAQERQTNPVLKRINDIIASGSLNDSWGVSSTEFSANSSVVHHVRLKGGVDVWVRKVVARSRVVALRGFNCG